MTGGAAALPGICRLRRVVCPEATPTSYLWPATSARHFCMEPCCVVKPAILASALHFEAAHSDVAAGPRGPGRAEPGPTLCLHCSAHLHRAKLSGFVLIGTRYSQHALVTTDAGMLLGGTLQRAPSPSATLQTWHTSQE